MQRTSLLEREHQQITFSSLTRSAMCIVPSFELVLSLQCSKALFDAFKWFLPTFRHLPFSSMKYVCSRQLLRRLKLITLSRVHAHDNRRE